MAVLIEDMEMPTRCFDCPIEYVDDWREIYECMLVYKGYTGETRMTGRLAECPLRDVQPVRKGCFIGTEYDGYADGSPVFYEWKCSECGCIFEDEEPTYNYCPNCGADMRGEQNDG